MIENPRPNSEEPEVISGEVVEPAHRQQTVQVRMPSVQPNVTYVLIGITVFFYILQFISPLFFGYDNRGLDWLVHYGGQNNTDIRDGELWRFITPLFLHGSVTHIFFNMYALLSLGTFVERNYGHARFALIYFLSGFTGNVFSFLFIGENGYSIGASTAIFGLIGAEAVFFYQNRRLFGAQARQALSNIGFIVVINLFIGLAPGIDNWGHVGGLLGGVLFATIAGTVWEVAGIQPDMHFEDKREFRDWVTGAGLVLIVFGVLAFWGFVK